MADNQPTYIEIAPDGIKTGFHSLSRIEENGMFSWYIPAYDIYFSSKTREEGQKRGHALVQSFFNIWLEEGFRSFVLQIHKLGFKSPMHELTIRDLISKKISNAKFKSKSNFVPEEFIGAESSIQESNMALA